MHVCLPLVGANRLVMAASRFGEFPADFLSFGAGHFPFKLLSKGA